jgi:hypothetical protein
MGTGSTDAPPSQSEAAASMETVAPRVTDVASRVSLDSPFSKRL